MTVTVKEMRPIYVEKPYIIVSKDNMVLHAGTFESCFEFGEYYDNCILKPREHDLFMNDNTKIKYKTRELPMRYLGYIPKQPVNEND